MVAIAVEGEEVVVRVLGWHRFWALRGSIRFRRDQVRSVQMADRKLWPPWCRCPGTFMPRLIGAGTYYGRGRKEFWDTRFRGRAFQIDLEGGPFTRIVVDVEDPQGTLQALTAPAR